MPDHHTTTYHVPPPRTTPVTILVADELLFEVVGRPIYCNYFEIDPRSDGFYDLIVNQRRGDQAATDAEAQFDD